MLSLVSVKEKSQGLYLLKKLSREHVYLKSHSRMRVDLAVQVRIIFIATFIRDYSFNF